MRDKLGFIAKIEVFVREIRVTSVCDLCAQPRQQVTTMTLIYFFFFFFFLL